MKNKRRIIAMLLAIVSFVSMFAVNLPTVSAATSPALVNKIRSLCPITCYAMPSSGASRIYAYSDETLGTQQSAYYVDSFSEQIVITNISDNGKAVKVRYLSGTGAARDKWFRTDDVLGLNGVGLYDFQATANMTVYRMGTASTVKSYGSISKGSDICYKLGNHYVGGTEYYTVVYKLTSAATCNGISVKHKMGLVNRNTFNSGTKSLEAVVTSCHPVKDSRIANNVSRGWATYVSSNSTRQYHLGLDYTVRKAWESDLPSYNLDVCAFAAGTVKAVGFNQANGYYVIIAHTISGKTVYSFSGHLAQNSICVSVGQTVTAGTKIATMGKTGSSAGSNIHLHFAIADKLWSGGGYWGYSTYFTGNQTTYDGVTYYNPAYVIANGKLPTQ